MDGVDDPLDLTSLTVSSDYIFLKCRFLQTLLDDTGSSLSGISFTGFVLFREDMAFDSFPGKAFGRLSKPSTSKFVVSTSMCWVGFAERAVPNIPPSKEVSWTNLPCPSRSLA
mmetsp:Transcript_4484/g.7693  ORF Transcript_4484/g.7693 Transcript_4484/m.7693 type:complete len:113 (-) Transcript_4484:198-536(-)